MIDTERYFVCLLPRITFATDTHCHFHFSFSKPVVTLWMADIWIDPIFLESHTCETVNIKILLNMATVSPDCIVIKLFGTDCAFFFLMYRLDLQFLSTKQTQHGCGLFKIYESVERELYSRTVQSKKLLEALSDSVIQPGITPGRLLTGIHFYCFLLTSTAR